MPPTALQSRIAAFESLANGSASHLSPPPSPPSPPRTPPSPPSSRTAASPSPSPPNLGRRSSLIDLHEWVLDDTQGAAPPPIKPSKPPPKPRISNPATPTQASHSAPLINLDSPPLLHKQPKRVAAPPLPPRKPSRASLKSDAAQAAPVAFLYPPSRSDSRPPPNGHSYPPLPLDLDSRPRNPSSHAPASSISSFHSVSLSSDTDPSTPGSVSNFIANFPIDTDHGRDSFTSKELEPDNVSLTDSYENVSTSSLASPATERAISLDWENAMARRKPGPPKLPQRPSSTAPALPNRASVALPPSRPPSTAAIHSSPTSPRSKPRPASSSSSSSSVIATNYAARRPPPPLPSRAGSDRSSILSTTSSSSHSRATNGSSGNGFTQYVYINSVQSLKAKRPTPVPPSAKKRYQAVFNANVIQRRKAEKLKESEKPSFLSPSEGRGRRAAGWRGLSVDLIVGPDEPDPTKENKPADGVDQFVSATERLEGVVVKYIWSRSKLDSEKLAEIWSECDPSNRGSLDLEAFSKGMWRIDEELRRMQTETLKSASTASFGSFRSKSSTRPAGKPSRPRDILR